MEHGILVSAEVKKYESKRGYDKKSKQRLILSYPAISTTQKAKALLEGR
jgi:hypothetical protein